MSGTMMPLGALLLRDMRIAVRVGGGALIGVLFFVVVVTLTPFRTEADAGKILLRVEDNGPAVDPSGGNRTVHADRWSRRWGPGRASSARAGWWGRSW